MRSNPYSKQDALREEAWYETAAGREAFERGVAAMVRLLEPRSRERLLDVGCGTGRHLEAFKGMGLEVTGVEPSPDMLGLARRRVKEREMVIHGLAEDLPFEDNEFELVILNVVLEFVVDPWRALAEAVRVARRRVFVGAVNSLSLTGLSRRVQNIYPDSGFNYVRLFTLWELGRLLRETTGSANIRWESIGILPGGATGVASFLERSGWLKQIPIGGLLGVAADVAYTVRTDNLTVRVKTPLNAAPTPKPWPTGCSPRFRGQEPENTGPMRSARRGEIEW